MARMIPDVVDPAAPSSERRVFELLKHDPATAAWSVYHSVGLSSAYTGAYGEIDFVALIPGRGILCIEVKGGRVECHQGVWTTTNRKGETSSYPRSPFAQAREGMFKLLAAIQATFGNGAAEARCPLGWAVIFTDTVDPPPSPDYVRAELTDELDLARQPAIRLQNAPSLQTALARFGAPSASVLASLGRFLRPDFDRVPSLASTLWDAERQLIVLTERQYAVLDNVAENEFSLITGGAGTGKTMLAVELARRAAAAGRSVLLTCFNRELGDWLEERARELGDLVTAGNLHRLVRPRLEAADLLKDVDENNPAGWFEAAAMAIEASDERFDLVILDEAQDFAAASVVPVLKAWLVSKEARPALCLFGDFSRQALYAAPEDNLETLRRLLRPAALPLRRNCRNTRKIAIETEAIIGAFDVRTSEQQPLGQAVERIFFADPGDQLAAVDRAIAGLSAEGFTARDIVVLGPRRLENSVLAGVSASGGLRIVDRGARKGGAAVTYATIQAFKGLESPAVVLVDIEPQPDAATDALLYVGMTRARTRLVMIMPQTSRAEVSRREKQHLAAALSGG